MGLRLRRCQRIEGRRVSLTFLASCLFRRRKKNLRASLAISSRKLRRG